jgi:hypothetical protein
LLPGKRKFAVGAKKRGDEAVEALNKSKIGIVEGVDITAE